MASPRKPKVHGEIFVGIDPGKRGALAAIDDTRRVLLVAKAPDGAAGMADLVREVRRLGRIRLAVLERTQAMPGNGVVAMHTYGRHAGAWEGVLAALRIPVVQPYPKVWQVVVRAPGCRRGETKRRSLASARCLFGVTLTRSQDGVADALHMALWGLRVRNPRGGLYKGNRSPRRPLMSKMSRRKKLQLVQVSWVDADHAAGWVNDQQVNDEEQEGQAYGLLVHKTPKFVAIAHQYNRDSGDWLGIFRIPAGMVRKITVLKTYHAPAEVRCDHPN